MSAGGTKLQGQSSSSHTVGDGWLWRSGKRGDEGHVKAWRDRLELGWVTYRD
ncbi:hypothetical protein ACE6H2_006214 [Prunus campanulata]